MDLTAAAMAVQVTKRRIPSNCTTGRDVSTRGASCDLGDERGCFAVLGIERERGPRISLRLGQLPAVTLEGCGCHQAVAMPRMPRENRERFLNAPPAMQRERVRSTDFNRMLP